MNILITSAGKRVSLVREFQEEAIKKKSGIRVLTCDAAPELSAASQVSDRSFKVPPVSSGEYIETLNHICIQNDVRLIVPTIDPELLILSKCKSKFKDTGIEIIISDHELIKVFRDKRLTHVFFDKLGIDRARDIDLHSPSFPFFVKPADGSCSQGISVISGEKDLNALNSEDGQNMYVEFLDPAEHTEYTIDMYFDRSSRLICCVPRKRIEVRAGEVNKGVTCKNALVPYVFDKFNSQPGLFGCLNFQVFINNRTQKIYGVEINPRFGGGYPLSYHAGANFPRLIIDEYLFSKELSYNDTWIDNMLLLRYDAEIILPYQGGGNESGC